MVIPSTRRVLNVFLASPRDVLDERRIADEVVSDLNKLVGRRLGCQIDLFKWEDITPGFGAPQDRINPDVDSCDLFIGLLWERWGHPTAAYTSGFQEEFERARARRMATGTPEIWLVFKRPRSEKLDEPGPQLSEVLKFREKQIELGEVHFSDVKDGAEWRGKVQSWLFAYVFDRYGERVQPSSPATSPPAGESPRVNTQSVQGQSKEKIPEQLENLSASIASAVKSGQLEFSIDEAKFLSEFDIARLYLLATTWIGRRYTADFLATHEVNLLYKYRRELEATSDEEFELFRTILHDEANVAPGWFWFRELPLNVLSGTLFSIVTSDRDRNLRARALQVMRCGGIRLTNEVLPSLPLSDDSEKVSEEAFKYLASVGDESTLPFIEASAKTDGRSSVKRAGFYARISVLLRSHPNKAFLELISESKSTPKELLDAFKKAAPNLSTEVLRMAIETQEKARKEIAVRELVVEELARRGGLTLELAQTLRDDSSTPIKQLALQEIVNRVGKTELDKLRTSEQKQRDPWTVLLAGRREVDVNAIAFNYYRTLPEEKLVAEIDWLSTQGPIAYRVLVADHYKTVSALVRSDLETGFERIRTQLLEAFSPEEAQRVSQSLSEKKLDDFIRSRYIEAALLGLAEHPEASDLLIARKHLQDESHDVRLAATKIISRLGDANDVQKLLDITDDSWGELQGLAAATAIRLSPSPDQLALEMAKAGGAAWDKPAFEWLIGRDSPEIRDYFRDLLTAESSEKRLRGVYYLMKKLANSELERLLQEYIERNTYYYDVVTWLDRLLYAGSLTQMYRHDLEESI